MKPYKSRRSQFRYEIKNGKCVCVISGIPINEIKQLSLEHWVPKCRWDGIEVTEPYNIYPAHKIINSLKGSMLPCEFWINREKIYKRAIQHYNLKRDEKRIVQAALNFIPYYKLNPCDLCFLYESCYESR